MIRGLLTTTDQVVGIQGGAGTGKTTALGIVREIAEEHGLEVRGLAPTSRARNALQESGIHAETLQKHLLRSKSDSEEAKPRLYFVDESSLSSTAADLQISWAVLGRGIESSSSAMFDNISL